MRTSSSFTLSLGAALLAACSTEVRPEVVPWVATAELPFALEADPSGPPVALAAEVGAVVPGGVLAVRVDGAAPHRQAWLVASGHEGAGACPPELRGACLDLASPLMVLGYARTDAGGTAVISVDVPSTLEAEVEFQVVVLAGQVGLSQAVWRMPHTTHWSYEGLEGPETWDALSSRWADCDGQAQSPVDVGGGAPGGSAPLVTTSAPGGTRLVNNGHTWQVDYGPGNYLSAAGTIYGLKQFHFHTPSEHEVGGVGFAMEMHLVHADPWGRLGVVGVLFEEGAENPFLAQFWGSMPAEEGVAAVPVAIDPYAVLPANRDYAHYAGSLTTPPCSEIVSWMVMTEPQTASVGQISALHASVGENNRPVQPLQGRPLVSYSGN